MVLTWVPIALRLSNEALQNTETGCYPGSFSAPPRYNTLTTEVKSRHYSKRVGDVVPGVMVYLRHLHLHSSRVEGFSGLINGLIAAAIGALSMLG